ncbi:MAG TPA: signal peptidase I [Candidatus Acidoferrales bacterium]|nr:signal peptidase I [Candidatus Acidoferrales bacterium]
MAASKTLPAPEVLASRERMLREVRGWLWVILAFLFIQGTLVQARVIPSESMVKTLLIGDHVLVSRFGYDAEIPFSELLLHHNLHASLWRNPQRQQIIVFHAPLPGHPDFVKRLIGMPGDTLEIRAGAVWINGKPLTEPYLADTPDPLDPSENRKPVNVPPDSYFVMGDNRNNSYDSRFWGFVPRSAIVGTPLFIYLSLDAPSEAWQPGHIRERLNAYHTALLHPGHVRWRRLFVPF